MHTRVIVVMKAAVFFGAASAALTGVAAADPAQTVVIPMNALNGSGESGTTTLKAAGNKTIVTIKLSNGSGVEQPAHFHVGNCDKYEPRPKYPLEDVVDGKSTTTLDIPISQLIGGDLIVNVHKSYADIATQAACGIAKP